MNWRDNLALAIMFGFFISVTTLIFAASYRVFFPVCPCTACNCMEGER